MTNARNLSRVPNAVTTDSSGNLGLGVTPSAWDANYKTLDIGFGSALTNPYSYTATWLLTNAYHNGTNFIYKNSAQATYYAQAAGDHYWYTAPSGTAGNAISFTQAMTLDASGNLLVGTTSVGGYGITLGPTGGSRILKLAGTATANQFIFANDNGSVGYIQTSGSSTLYLTSSDYRLKENIQPMQNALATVAQLNPVTYTWKADGSDGQGFIAHELQAVVPDCATGEKDAVDAEGNPVYQGIDTSFLVATLTKAIQEQQEQINQLKAEVAALKG